MRRLSHLRGLADGSLLRMAEFDGATCIVVPVVALCGDAIIRPLNSEGPEFVSSAELAAAPKGFNGRPCVPDHPDGGRASANEPETLERMKFGQVFNSRFDATDNKLKMEAWLDVARAEKVGPDAVRVIERCKAGEMVEVSVGVWVTLERAIGFHKGERYTAKWNGIIPDHLALLPEGATGACSVASGCGAPRAAKYNGNHSLIPRAELRATDTKERRAMTENVKQRLRSLFGDEASALLQFRNAEESVSDMELRSALDLALFAEEPGYLGIDAVFSSDNVVVYAVAPEQRVMLYRRGFTIAGDGEVSLAAEKEEVMPVTRYEPVASVTAAGDGSCTCHKQSQTETAKGGGTMAAATAKVSEKAKEAATRLIANTRSPYTEEFREHLEALGEDKLIALEAGFAEPSEGKPTAPTPPATPAPTPTPKPDDEGNGEEKDTVAVSKDELASLRRLAAKQEAQDRKRKDELVAALKGAQKVHSEASLKTLSLDRLEEIAALVEIEPAESSKSSRGAANYVGRTLPMDDADDVAEPPDTWRLTAAREKRKQGSAAKEVN